MGKPVVHWEMWSGDPGKVSDFYMKPKKGPWPGNLALYIDVEDLGTYRKKIQEAGGKILVEQQDVPGVGSFSLFEDPDSRVLGLWKQSH